MEKDDIILQKKVKKKKKQEKFLLYCVYSLKTENKVVVL